MKHLCFVITVMVSFISMSADADKYQVLDMNSSNIRIGKSVVKKGLLFDDKEEIYWNSDKQCIKVLNLKTYRITVFSAEEFESKNVRTIYAYFHNVKHMSTREYGPMVLEVDTIHYLFDTLRINSGIHYGDNVIDELVVTKGNKVVKKRIWKTQDKKFFLIPRDIYDACTHSAGYVDIIETDNLRNWTYCIYRNLYVEPLPLRLD